MGQRGLANTPWGRVSLAGIIPPVQILTWCQSLAPVTPGSCLTWTLGVSAGTASTGILPLTLREL